MTDTTPPPGNVPDGPILHAATGLPVEPEADTGWECPDCGSTDEQRGHVEGCAHDILEPVSTEPEQQPRRHVVRGGHGRFDKNPDAAHIDAECCRLRARSMSYTQIAAELGISVSRAYDGVKRGIAAIVREPAEDALALELEKLDALERQYLDILQDVHPVLYQGQDTGFQDNGPKMQALAGLLRTSESRRKLLGLDQPARVAVSGGIAYTLNGVDLKDVT